MTDFKGKMRAKEAVQMSELFFYRYLGLYICFIENKFIIPKVYIMQKTLLLLFFFRLSKNRA